MKKLIYFMVFSVFLGTQILAIDIGFKLSLYRILFLCVCGTFVTLMMNNDKRLSFYPRKISNSYIMFYGVRFLYSLASIGWAKSFSGWAKANVFIGIGFFTMLFIHLFIKEKKDVLFLFKSIALGVILHIFIGFFELFSSKYLWASDHFITKYQPESRDFFTRIPISIYPNENDYATILLMGSFFLLILLWNTKNIFYKLIYGVLWISSFFLINQTDSRANVLAFAVGLSVMVLIYLRKVITKKMLLSIFAIAASGSIAALVISSSLQEQLSSILLLFSKSQEYGGSSNETRINLIKNGFSFLQQSFGFGIGAGNIEYWMKTVAPFQTGGISNMHNWWMEILTAYGIFVFVLYILVYVGMILKAYAYYRSSKDSFIRRTSLAFIGYLSAFTIASISSATNITNEWQWVIFGVIIVFYSYCEKKEPKKKQLARVSSAKLNSDGIYHSVGGNNG